MSLDGQVLVVAFFAVGLKLFLWYREYMVVVDVEPDRKDVLHRDDRRAATPSGSAARRN